jgi:hypothetical protein
VKVSLKILGVAPDVNDNQMVRSRDQVASFRESRRFGASSGTVETPPFAYDFAPSAFFLRSPNFDLKAILNSMTCYFHRVEPCFFGFDIFALGWLRLRPNALIERKAELRRPLSRISPTSHLRYAGRRDRPPACFVLAFTLVADWVAD